MQYDLALEIAMKLKIELAEGCTRLEIVGSVKRNDKPDVHDIEILCIPDLKVPRPEMGKIPHRNMLEKQIWIMQNKMDMIGPAKLNGDKMKKFRIHGIDDINPFYLDLFIVREETWAIQNVIRTGPSEFSHRFVTNKRFGGLLPDHYEYQRGETMIKESGGNGIVELKEEQDAIELLGLGWIPPEKRRNYIK